MSSANTLTGEIIRDQIVTELKKHNLQSYPAIDNARQFPLCQSPLLIKSIFGSWKTVKVSCAENDWNIAIRTNIHKNITSLENRNYNKNNLSKSLVILKTSLNKGDVIKSIHLTYFKSEKNIGGGVFYEKNELTGRTLKKALSAGTVIKARHLNPDWVIVKGQIVTIEHQVGNIIINAQGVAQEAGQIGQRIWVNNFNSGKKVLCWINNDKKVTTNAKIY